LIYDRERLLYVLNVLPKYNITFETDPGVQSALPEYGFTKDALANLQARNVQETIDYFAHH